MSRFLLFLLRHASWLAAILIVLVTVLNVRAFSHLDYWYTLSQDYFAAAALALALTPIILTGGIDLSVGSAAVFASVVIGILWRDAEWPIGMAVAGGVCAGLAVGLLNGCLVNFGVWPLVATLATRELFRGLAQSLAGDHPVERIPDILIKFWHEPTAGLPISLIALIGLFIVSYVGVHHTWPGRMLFALGDNERAARFAGLPVKRIQLAIYGWSGLVAGLCGAALVMNFEAAKADAEKSLDLTAIACVVLGGIRITGGAGHVGGTVLGIVTVVMLLAGLSDAAPNWRETLAGTLLIVVAVANEAGARLAAKKSMMLSRGLTL